MRWVLFSVKTKKNKKEERPSRRYNFDEADNEFLHILEKLSNNCIACKHYKIEVGNLFETDKMKFNQIVNID